MPKLKKRELKWIIIAALVLGMGVWYCRPSRTHYPKPAGYPRIDLPVPEYQLLADGLPYRFEVSRYARVQMSTDGKSEKYWIDILYPAFDAVIQITYKAVRGDQNRLRSYCEDAYRLSSKHQSRASAMRECLHTTLQGDSVVFIEIDGQVPSPAQFYATDADCHFLRGALYFNTACQNEYLRPVIDFIKADLKHLFHTLTWTKWPQDESA